MLGLLDRQTVRVYFVCFGSIPVFAAVSPTLLEKPRGVPLTLDDNLLTLSNLALFILLLLLQTLAHFCMF